MICSGHAPLKFNGLNPPLLGLPLATELSSRCRLLGSISGRLPLALVLAARVLVSGLTGVPGGGEI